MRVAAAEAFLVDRLVYVLTARGLAADEVGAVVELPAGEADGRVVIGALRDPQDALGRAVALQHVRREVPEDFAALAESFEGG